MQSVTISELNALDGPECAAVSDDSVNLFGGCHPMTVEAGARSAFKLIELDDKYKFLQPGTAVLDCGAAPGAWSQVLAKRTNSDGNSDSKAIGKVVAVDILPFHPIAGVTSFPLSDFTLQATQTKIRECLPDGFDVILSDMAPSASGVASLDHEQIIDLCHSVLSFSKDFLKKDGTLLVKLWNGGRTKELEKVMKLGFERIKTVKPDSSRKDSAEIYLLGLKYNKHRSDE